MLVFFPYNWDGSYAGLSLRYKTVSYSNLKMNFSFLFLLLTNAFLNAESEKLSGRYLASENAIQFTEKGHGHFTSTPVTFYDITTLSECAVKSLMVHGSSFFYSGTEKTCVLTGRFPPGTFSQEYKHYIKEEKGKKLQRILLLITLKF